MDRAFVRRRGSTAAGGDNGGRASLAWLVLVLLSVVIGASAVSARPPEEIRPGSVLKRDKPLEEGHVDLRGGHERQRDAELIKHFGRMAELDVIAKVARDGNDVGLLERVDDVRRKEVQRHQRVMMLMVRQSQAALLRGEQ